MNDDNLCIDNWRTLHDNGYFENHPHYRNWKLDASAVAFQIMKYAGLYSTDDVLEIGCGYGRIMYAVSDHVNTVKGIDLHEAPLKKAIEILRVKPNTEVIMCTGQTIPLPDNTVDLVYSFSAMQHMPRSIVEKYLVEIIRVLKPGGRFCLQFLSAPMGLEDINPQKAQEQSVGWERNDLINLASRHFKEFTVYAYPLILKGEV